MSMMGEKNQALVFGVISLRQRVGSLREPLRLEALACWARQNRTIHCQEGIEGSGTQ